MGNTLIIHGYARMIQRQEGREGWMGERRVEEGGREGGRDGGREGGSIGQKDRQFVFVFFKGILWYFMGFNSFKIVN